MKIGVKWFILKSIFYLGPSHSTLVRSLSNNSPVINKHMHNALQVPSSPIHSASSTDSIDCTDNTVTGTL